jgi:hypothetical protein
MTPIKRLHHRERLALAIVLGGLVGAIIALSVWVLVENGDRISEVQQSRVSSSMRSCREGNERHAQAVIGLERLIARNPAGQLTRARVLAQRQALDEFAEVIAPTYNCKRRVAEQTRP